jgi:hypothetical protein
LDSPKALDITLDIFRAVKSLLGDPAGWLLFYQALVAIDRPVRDRTTHVVNGAATWDQFTDRLVDGAVILKITGRSYRAHRASPMSETNHPEA